MNAFGFCYKQLVRGHTMSEEEILELLLLTSAYSITCNDSVTVDGIISSIKANKWVKAQKRSALFYSFGCKSKLDLAAERLLDRGALVVDYQGKVSVTDSGIQELEDKLGRSAESSKIKELVSILAIDTMNNVLAAIVNNHSMSETEKSRDEKRQTAEDADREYVFISNAIHSSSGDQMAVYKFSDEPDKWYVMPLDEYTRISRVSTSDNRTRLEQTITTDATFALYEYEERDMDEESDEIHNVDVEKEVEDLSWLIDEVGITDSQEQIGEVPLSEDLSNNIFESVESESLETASIVAPSDASRRDNRNVARGIARAQDKERAANNTQAIQEPLAFYLPKENSMRIPTSKTPLFCEAFLGNVNKRKPDDCKAISFKDYIQLLDEDGIITSTYDLSVTTRGKYYGFRSVDNGYNQKSLVLGKRAQEYSIKLFVDDNKSSKHNKRTVAPLDVKIAQLDDSGKIIGIYGSIQEASVNTEIPVSSIKRVIDEDMKDEYGCSWKQIVDTAELGSELRRRLTPQLFEEIFIDFMRQADINMLSRTANGSKRPVGFENNNQIDGADFSQHFGMGSASRTPYLNWWVVSIYYIVNSGKIVLGIEDDRYPHLDEMNPIGQTYMPNKKKNIAVFYRTTRDQLDYNALRENFLMVAEEVMTLGLE